MDTTPRPRATHRSARSQGNSALVVGMALALFVAAVIKQTRKAGVVVRSDTPDEPLGISVGQTAARQRDDRDAEQGNTAHARRVLAGERRALSVRRPWANLIFAGKTTENRTWATTHRGELVVHAGQAWDPAGAALAVELGLDGFTDPRTCPGGYLGIVRLADVHLGAGCCAPWGVSDQGIYHWTLAEPRSFAVPIAGRGRLGLYRVPADLLAAADD